MILTRLNNYSFVKWNKKYRPWTPEPAQTAAPKTRPQITQKKLDGWMDGWMDYPNSRVTCSTSNLQEDTLKSIKHEF